MIFVLLVYFYDGIKVSSSSLFPLVPFLNSQTLRISIDSVFFSKISYFRCFFYSDAQYLLVFLSSSLPFGVYSQNFYLHRSLWTFNCFNYYVFCFNNLFLFNMIFLERPHLLQQSNFMDNDCYLLLLLDFSCLRAVGANSTFHSLTNKS